jgi:hypothetical protein
LYRYIEADDRRAEAAHHESLTRYGGDGDGDYPSEAAEEAEASEEAEGPVAAEEAQGPIAAATADGPQPCPAGDDDDAGGEDVKEEDAEGAGAVAALGSPREEFAWFLPKNGRI